MRDINKPEDSSSFIKANRDLLHRNIFTLAWPAVLEYLLYTITMMADMIMVSRLGTDSIAAVGLANTIGFIFISVFGFPLRISSQALSARFAGARQPERIRDAGGNSLGLGFIIGTVISLLGIFGGRWMLVKMGASESVVMLGTGYIQFILGIALFRIIFYVCSGILRGMGDTRTPMFIMVFANLFNVLFNYLLIFGIGVFPRLGVLGAGIATGGAYVLAGTIILIMTVNFRRGVPIRTRDIRRLNMKMIRNIWRIAMPAAFETGVRRLGLLIFMRMVTALGTIALAAHQLAIRIEAFSFMIGVGFGVVSNTLVGQSLGAKKDELAEDSIRITSYYAIGLMTLLAFVFVLFPKFVFQIFNPAEPVMYYAVIALTICAFEQIPLGLFMVITGGFKGAGDTRTPMIISAIGSLIVRVPLVYLFAFRMNLGFVGVWLGAIIDWTVKALLGIIAFKWGKWKQITYE